MPNYDYECQKCGYVFEVFQKITDKPLTKCPKCQGRLKRLIGSGGGLIFKGPGFYITDYKKNNKKEASSQKSNKENVESKPAGQNNKQTSKNETKTNN